MSSVKVTMLSARNVRRVARGQEDPRQIMAEQTRALRQGSRSGSLWLKLVMGYAQTVLKAPSEGTYSLPSCSKPVAGRGLDVQSRCSVDTVAKYESNGRSPAMGYQVQMVQMVARWSGQLGYAHEAGRLMHPEGKIQSRVSPFGLKQRHASQTYTYDMQTPAVLG